MAPFRARVDPIEIVGERELLSEAVHGEVARAAENIVEHCESYLHGRCDVKHIRRHAEDLNALLELFAHTERAPELGLDDALHTRP